MRNRTWMAAGSLAIVAAITACCVMLTVFRIEERVFFQNYLTLQSERFEDEEGILSSRQYEFEIQYLTNWDDRHSFSWMEFPDYPGLIAYATDPWGHWSFFPGDENWFQNPDTYGLYAIKNHRITIWLDGDDDSSLYLSSAVVYFNDGTEQLVDLGEIVLDMRSEQDGLLDMKSNEHSSRDEMKTVYTAKERIVLQAVNLPGTENADSIGSMVEISINGVDYRDIAGIALEEGAELVVESCFEPPEGTRNCYNQYSLSPELIYTDEQGDMHADQLNTLYYEPYYGGGYNFKELAAWLRERGDV